MEAASAEQGGSDGRAAPEPRYAIHRPHVLEELIDDELVVINFETGRYHGIRGTGVEIWRLLEAGFSVGELTARLTRRYSGVDESANLAVAEFVSELAHQRLIVHRTKDEPEPDGGQEAGDVRRRAFVVPELDSRDDLADYLALDPIHDVDERGWPNVRR